MIDTENLNTLQKRYVDHVERLVRQFVKKNNDYGCSFQKTVLGIPASKCNVVRLMDKVRRIENILSGNEAQVKSESVMDTLGDLSVYCVLVMLCLEDEAVAVPGR